MVSIQMQKKKTPVTVPVIEIYIYKYIWKWKQMGLVNNKRTLRNDVCTQFGIKMNVFVLL